MRPSHSLLLLVLLLAACEPQERRPGLWLSGEVVAEPVTDWSFTDAVPLIFVETRTWYGIPHSVTTVCAADGERLYVPSLYREAASSPRSVSGTATWCAIPACG